MGSGRRRLGERSRDLMLGTQYSGEEEAPHDHTILCFSRFQSRTTRQAGAPNQSTEEARSEMLPAPAIPLPGSEAPPAPLPVAGHQFCAPYVVPLTVTKKALSISDGDFVITDANGAVVLTVKGSIFSIHNRRVLLDAAGLPLLSMEKKVFSMHHRWEVFRGDSTNAGDLLFSVKKSSMIQFKTEMDVFLAGNTAQQACDFKIKGSYLDRSCAFYLGNSAAMIAQMNRKMTVSSVLLDKDTFAVTVFPHVDYVFIAALVVILDEVHRDKND